MVTFSYEAQGNKRKPGRPPAGPYEGKRKTLSTRITPELRDKLEAASKASGRSLSQEIELRLDRSFQTDVQLHVWTARSRPMFSYMRLSVANTSTHWPG